MDKKELYKKTSDLLREYLIKTIDVVGKMVEEGKGKEITGDVKNRPEDFETSIDLVGEKILEELIEKYKLPILIFPEHNKSLGKKENPEIFGALDSFDGTKLFYNGFEHMWYSVLSFYDKESNPIFGGVADILREKLYLSEEGGNYLVSLNSNKKEKIFPSKVKSLSQNPTIASYIMSNQYFPKFFRYFGDLIETMNPKTLLYPNGGSCIYAYLASGNVDAYIMFNEPRSEIDPGLALAKKAECQIVSVNSDGTYEDYKFLPWRQHDKVDLLIATSTPEFRDILIKHYAKQHTKN